MKCWSVEKKIVPFGRADWDSEMRVREWGRAALPFRSTGGRVVYDWVVKRIQDARRISLQAPRFYVRAIWKKRGVVRHSEWVEIQAGQYRFVRERLEAYRRAKQSVVAAIRADREEARTVHMPRWQRRVAEFWARRLSILQEPKRPATFEPHVGIEIECGIVSDCLTSLRKRLAQGPYAKQVELKGDGSLNGAFGAGRTALEVALVSPQEHLAAAVREVCAALREAGATVNRFCGLHVHLDARQVGAVADSSTAGRLYDSSRVAEWGRKYLRVLPRLVDLVPQSRRGNRYCVAARTVNFHDRYRAVNFAAWNSHRTVEVRLHSGTTDAEKILAWVRLLLAIPRGEFRRAPRTVNGLLRRCGISREDARYWMERARTFAADAEITN